MWRALSCGSSKRDAGDVGGCYSGDVVAIEKLDSEGFRLTPIPGSHGVRVHQAVAGGERRSEE
jgi:hypothetical protein